jgi:hypothetical protein
MGHSRGGDAIVTAGWVDSDEVGGLPRPYARNPGMIKTMLKTMRFKASCFSAERFDVRAGADPRAWPGPVRRRRAGRRGRGGGRATYRFLWFHPERLKTGAPIGSGWLDAPQERKATQFRFDVAR